MATTTINSENVRKFWSREVLLQMEQDGFVPKFVGGTKYDPIYRVPGVGKKPGDTVSIPLCFNPS